MACVPEIKVLRERCVRCGDCIELCPQSGDSVSYPVFISAGDTGEIKVENPESCFGCMTCVEFCRASAVIVSGAPSPTGQQEVFPARKVINMI